MKTAIEVLEELKKILEKNFSIAKNQIETSSGKVFFSSISQFYTKSLDEALVGEDEFGFLWVSKQIFESGPGPLSRPVKSVIDFRLGVVLIERTDVLGQLTMSQEILFRSLLLPGEINDIQKDYSMNLEGSDDLDHTFKKGNNRYVTTGISITLTGGL